MSENSFPNFDTNKLIPVVVQHAVSKDVLMLAYMNLAAYKETLRTGQAHYWSRSRNSLWHKGATSGNYQFVKEIYIDCDADALLLLVHSPRPGVPYRTKVLFLSTIAASPGLIRHKINELAGDNCGLPIQFLPRRIIC